MSRKQRKSEHRRKTKRKETKKRN